MLGISLSRTFLFCLTCNFHYKLNTDKYLADLSETAYLGYQDLIFLSTNFLIFFKFFREDKLYKVSSLIGD